MSPTCPRCKQSDRVSTVTSDDSNGTGVFLFGGILGYLLHRESHKNRLLCARCDHVFARPSTTHPARIIATSLFLLLVTAAALYFAWHASANYNPNHPATSRAGLHTGTANP